MSLDLVRVPHETIAAVAGTCFPEVDQECRDEMAIPSYVHPNAAIRWLMWRRYRAVAGLLDLPDGAEVLDFGCGVGLFLPTLVANSRRTYAIDLFPQYAQLLAAKEDLAVTFLTNLEQVPDGSLDAITSTDVLEHVDDPEAIGRIFLQKLRPGGRVVISGPTESFLYRIGRTVAGFGGKGGYHKTNVDALLVDLSNSGLTLDRVVRLPWWFAPSLFKVALYHRP